MFSHTAFTGLPALASFHQEFATLVLSPFMQSHQSLFAKVNEAHCLCTAGVQDAGMVAYRFNTIGVSDGISMGTDGMSFSLQSRDLIADSVETVMGGQWYSPHAFHILWLLQSLWP